MPDLSRLTSTLWVYYITKFGQKAQNEVIK